MSINAPTIHETLTQMRTKLGKLIPDFELQLKAELVFEIQQLKRERNAIILGHNYMEPAVYHTVADVVGDSLELSRRAAATTNDPIIFCGVRFMAETAKILNPERTVLLPAKVAGCSLASSITADDVRDLKRRFPGVPVVSYINTYADVKAESDVICTSGNAKRVVDSLGAPVVIFLPDEYLASNVARECGRRIAIVGRDATNDPDIADQLPTIIGWRGRCEVHEQFAVEDIVQIRRQFPGVSVLAHPECSPEVVAASDYSQSTSRMVEFVRTSPAPHFLILTECSMADNIIAENPAKDILRMCSIRCPHMNEVTLQDILHALRHNQQVIEVDPAIAARARGALERMLAVK